jgi:predicted dinucleotide-binding enzyme
MGKSVGILGSGTVGQVLANGFKDLGYEVKIGRREAGAVENWDGPVGTFAEVARGSELVVLAVKGAVVEQIITDIAEHLSGKTVIDATNPIADQAPEDGVLKFFTSFDESLMERLQKLAPEAKFVKAFNSVGSARMVKPDFGGTKPTMFICGDDDTAKTEATEILEQLGWETNDMGTSKAARAIEPLAILYCIPGLRQNQWTHAFKLLV